LRPLGGIRLLKHNRKGGGGGKLRPRSLERTGSCKVNHVPLSSTGGLENVSPFAGGREIITAIELDFSSPALSPPSAGKGSSVFSFTECRAQGKMSLGFKREERWSNCTWAGEEGSVERDEGNMGRVGEGHSGKRERAQRRNQRT